MNIDLPRSILLLVSGPAGSGKTTLCDRLLAMYPEGTERVITATTRAPRGDEKDGVDYHFFSKELFEQRIEEKGFYEYAKVHQNYYGVPRREVEVRLAAKQDLLLNIDVQGASTLREVAKTDKLLASRLVTVFIMPESLAQIRQRLQGRATDAADEIERRIEVAKHEIEEYRHFDYCIVSGSIEADFERFRAIYLAEKNRLLGA